MHLEAASGGMVAVAETSERHSPKIPGVPREDLLRGPGGMISLLMTPILVIQNAVTYVGAIRKLRDAIE